MNTRRGYRGGKEPQRLRRDQVTLSRTTVSSRSSPVRSIEKSVNEVVVDSQEVCISSIELAMHPLSAHWKFKAANQWISFATRRRGTWLVEEMVNLSILHKRIVK